MSNELLITVASWEERFWLGTRRLVEANPPGRILSFYYNAYASWSSVSRGRLRRLCNVTGSEYMERELVNDNVAESWKALNATLEAARNRQGSITVDISTMPRETMWSILDIIGRHVNRVKYVYNMPVRYNSKWLTKDPERPRLVYRLGGEAKLGLPTAVVLVTGFDVDRVEQFISYFEPQRTILALQTGNLFGNQKRNRARHLTTFSNVPGVSTLSLDAYSVGHGYRELREAVAELTDTYNVILGSLGPKLSALSLFRIKREWPQTALAYAPSKEYNMRYSFGLGDAIEGVFDLAHRRSMSAH